MSKITTLLFSIGLIFSNSVFADENVPEFNPTRATEKLIEDNDIYNIITLQQEQLNDFNEALTIVMHTCKTKEICVYQEIERRAQDQNNPLQPLWAFSFQSIKDKKSIFEKMAKVCYNENQDKAQAVWSGCMVKRYQHPEQISEVENMNCLIDGLRPLAEAGNVHATYLLMGWDEENRDKWSALYKTQQKSEPYKEAIETTKACAKLLEDHYNNQEQP